MWSGPLLGSRSIATVSQTTRLNELCTLQLSHDVRDQGRTLCSSVSHEPSVFVDRSVLTAFRKAAASTCLSSAPDCTWYIDENQPPASDHRAVFFPRRRSRRCRRSAAISRSGVRGRSLASSSKRSGSPTAAVQRMQSWLHAAALAPRPGRIAGLGLTHERTTARMDDPTRAFHKPSRHAR